jgi:hypothetical protein
MVVKLPYDNKVNLYGLYQALPTHGQGKNTLDYFTTTLSDEGKKVF